LRSALSSMVSSSRKHVAITGVMPFSVSIGALV
jgi:hypothetical protein